MVDVWLHRVDEDASGLTFQEWDPSADTDASQAPAAIIVNSSDFDMRVVILYHPRRWRVEAGVRAARL